MPPTEAMTDIIVKIMVEVLNILAIATMVMKEGRASAFLPGDKYMSADLFQKNISRGLREARIWKTR